MNPSVDALFQYTRSRVTDQDIVDFSPSDPGYPNYVKLWTQIRRSGIMSWTLKTGPPAKL